jgi:beta-N-acetylhexosaminidase
MLLLAIIGQLFSPLAAYAADTIQTATPPDPAVAQLVAQLTPQEKVGQLFLVTFQGTTIENASPIYELITRYHVSGVVLSTSRNNFTDQDFAANTHHLTTNLQAVAAGVVPTDSTSTPETRERQFLPLFIAVPYAEADLATRFGLPSPMTLGATWSVERTQAIGQLAGQDLAALGVNMVFGPTLDVVSNPQPLGPADQGAQLFGGNPYWVGKIGQAFIQGLHEGSDNHVAVMAQHFPGYGDGDRTLRDQIPAVNKSRDDLLAVDLAPFFTVTRDLGASADGLLVSHIRYSAFQGSLSDTVRPVSLDQQALTQLLNLPPLANWRSNGGVTVADALGSRAIRRFQDPTERNFSAFAAARDAFLAGNDLLYTAGFESTGENPAETVKTVLDQFVQKYQEDVSFAARVNEAATRILSLKLKLYGDLSFESVVANTGNLDQIGVNSTEGLAVTQAAATLLSPTGLTSRPQRTDNVVFLTNTRPVQACGTCAPLPTVAVDALQEQVLRLYGPRGTGEALRQNFTSLTFTELTDFLDNRVAPTVTPAPTSEGVTATPEAATAVPPPNVENALRNADWIVVSLLDVTAVHPESLAIRRLLAERSDLLRGKQIVVFAFDAPYYLDSTEVAQLSAYYALYNHTASAIQVAAQILFQEIAPTSVPPVSIPGTGFDLKAALQPDPNQDIRLSLESAPTSLNVTPAPTDLTPTPSALGVAVTLRTGIIKDRYGHAVPDGTLVRFYVTYASEGIASPSLFAEVPTVDGVATTSYRLDRVGTLEFSVTSGLAQRSDRVSLPVGPAGPGTPTVQAPPSRTPTATVVPSETPFVVPTVGVTTTPQPPPPPAGPVTWYDLLMTIGTLIVMGIVAARVTRSRTEAVSDGVKLFLIVAIGALIGYNYLALKLPGYDSLKELGGWAAPLVVWGGGLLGFGAGWWWLRRSKLPKS